MGKHSKKAGGLGAEAPTYHERRAMGYGTAKERLGKDSLGNYYDCRLTLTPAVDPVCCPNGFIFSREAIIENLLAQKKANKRQLAAWEAQHLADAQKQAEKSAIEQEAEILAFDRKNHAGASAATTTKIKQVIAAEAEELLEGKKSITTIASTKFNEDRIKAMKSFWAPSAMPEAEVRIEKPDMTTLCPSSGKKLKLKDLIQLKFTPVPGGQPHEYMDPITRDPFTNASHLVVLKSTGDVFLEETWDKCIKPDGFYDGKSVCDDDVLELKRGGTGYAKHNSDEIEASKFHHLGPGSGLADRRGQTAAGSSLFGLKLQ